MGKTTDRIGVIFILMAMHPWGAFFLLVAIIAGVRGCNEPPPPPDPIDISTESDGYLRFKAVDYVDTTGNGFRVFYKSAKNITPKRSDEMAERPEFDSLFARLQRASVKKFHNDLMNLDIYDFAELAVNFVTPEIEIDKIMGVGEKKLAMYSEVNPNYSYEDSLLNIEIINNPGFTNTRNYQGMVCIDNFSVYYNRPKRKRVYYYNLCRYNNSWSNKDEHWLHLSLGEVSDERELPAIVQCYSKYGGEDDY